MQPFPTEDDGYIHPTFAGDQTGGAGVSPAGWLWDNIRAWWTGSIADRSAGMPEPFSPRDMRPIGPAYFQPARWGDFHTILTRRFDRGADAYGYRFGAVTYNPIGPGVVATRPMEGTKPAANELPFGIGVTWGPQMINFGLTPLAGGGPLLDPQTAAALMGNEALAGSIPTGQFIPPPENGFGG